MLDLKRLRLLQEFSIRGTIAEVADVLSYSSSAVSQQLSLLEKQAAVPLFRKVGRGLELTAAGARLALDAERILTMLEEAEASLLRESGEVTGRIRIAAFQSAMISLMPMALKILGADHPGLRIEVVQHEPETALYETWARSFDMVIAEQYPGHSAPHHQGLDRVILGSDEIMLAVPLGSSLKNIAGASSMPWVMEPHGAASRHWAEQACRQAGFEPDVRFETADIQAHIKFVENGNAVALVNELAAHTALGRVKLIPLAGMETRRTIFTSSRLAKESNPALSAVNSALQQAALETPIRSV